MTYTEFVSADALIRNIAATTRKLHIDDRERPTAIQIYGREVEPMVEDCILMGAKNCIITPHIAWAPVETRERLMGIVSDNIKNFLNGTPTNKVN